MTDLLFVSSDIVPAGERSRLEECYALVEVRQRGRDLESYYQCVLERLTQHKRKRPEARVTLVETGLSLEDDAGRSPRSVLVLTDLIGLMLQPSCRTEDEQGQIQFTDVGQLFAPQRVDSAQRLLEKEKVPVRRGTAAAVVAPELLTAAERRALRDMGAEAAVTYLYLEARAARARRLPALGLVLHGGEPGGAGWSELLCRLATGIG